RRAANASGEVRLRDLAGEVPVDRAGTRCREQLLKLAQKLLHLLRVVRIRRATAGQTEAEWSICGHQPTLLRVPVPAITANAQRSCQSRMPQSRPGYARNP